MEILHLLERSWVEDSWAVKLREMSIQVNNYDDVGRRIITS